MTQLEEIEQVLADYENRYGMSSAEFLKKYESGQTDDSADAVEWASLTKMAGHFRRYKIQTDLATTEEELSEFEKHYNMSTAEFYSKYQAGQTDDPMDYVEWASLAQMAENLRKKLDVLT